MPCLTFLLHLSEVTGILCLLAPLYWLCMFCVDATTLRQRKQVFRIAPLVYFSGWGFAFCLYNFKANVCGCVSGFPCALIRLKGIFLRFFLLVLPQEGGFRLPDLGSKYVPWSVALLWNVDGPLPSAKMQRNCMGKFGNGVTNALNFQSTEYRWALILQMWQKWCNPSALCHVLY